MSRIIAGRAKGRTLVVPKSGTRPTSDRVRESLFSMLDSRIADWSEIRVLDLYAGSGALGLEAISRGAVAATLVDHAAAAISAIGKNVAAVGAVAEVEICKAQVGPWVAGQRVGRAPFSLVFADPPYDLDQAEISRSLELLAVQGLLEPGALIVVERSTRGLPFEFPESQFEPVAEREYGDTLIKIGLFIG